MTRPRRPTAPSWWSSLRGGLMSEPAQIRPILPGQSADLEIELEKALSHIETVEIPIRTLWDPWRCPLVALPYLAWALSVDQWESGWSETIKRRVVAASLDLHRIKGTRPAIEMALDALGVAVDIVEWFEADPPLPRGTAELTAWVSENLAPGEPGLLNDTVYQQIQTAVENSKNLRSHFTFKVGAQFSAQHLRLGAAITSVVSVAHRTADATQAPLAETGTVRAAAVSSATAIAHRTADVTPAPLAETGTVRLGAVAAATAIAHNWATLTPGDLSLGASCVSAAAAVRAVAVVQVRMESTT
ncbi:MAG: phage tail protein I [Aeromonas veronii]